MQTEPLAIRSRAQQALFKTYRSSDGLWSKQSNILNCNENATLMIQLVVLNGIQEGTHDCTTRNSVSEKYI